MRRTLLASLLLLPVLGCSDDTTVVDAAVVDGQLGLDGETDSTPPFDGEPPDGPGPDAAPTGVTEVSCTGASIVSVVTAPGFAYNITQPQVLVNDVVQFTMPSIHSSVSGTPAGVSDGRFTVMFNQTKCFRFTETGSYGFWCNPHQFVGTITVVAPAKLAP